MSGEQKIVSDDQKMRYLEHVENLYKKFYSAPHEDECACAYDNLDWDRIHDWQIVIWAACEVAHGHFHDGASCVERIRQELPWEHSNGWHLDYPVEAFERAYAENCPNAQGSTEAWYKVFQHVPVKILSNEDFFG